MWHLKRLYKVPSEKSRNLIPKAACERASVALLCFVVGGDREVASWACSPPYRKATSLRGRAYERVQSQSPSPSCSCTPKSVFVLYRIGVANLTTDTGCRGGSVALNRFRAFSKWFSASVMPPPLRVSAG